MGYKDPVKEKAYKKEHYEKNRDKTLERKANYRRDIKHHAINSIKNGNIIDQHTWDLFCNLVKRTNNKRPYSKDFTNELMFEKMTKGCYFCGDIATTIDRLDSTINHTPENCVGCCLECNNSKGIADPMTFVRKAYYRARRKYFDEHVDIWFEYNNKPKLCQYKKSAEKKNVPFDLSKEKFNELIISDCEYCQRAPTTCFGVDRVDPTEGYVIGNVVPCCWDCNLDKFEDTIETMMTRNERIACRVDNDDLIIDDFPRVILHRGTNKSFNKV
jgi:hypothetical protein